MLEHLRRTGHEALVIAPDTPPGEPPAERIHDGIRVHRVPARMFPKVTTLPLGVPRPRLLKVLRGFQPDVMHLASPALPIGAFSYSQGLESAIEHGLIHDGDSAREWIASGLTNVLARGELPFLAHQMTRWRDHDAAGLAAADQEFLASRESAELRRETQQMGWSLAQLCTQLEWGDAARLATLNAIKPISQPTAFAYAALASS